MRHRPALIDRADSFTVLPPGLPENDTAIRSGTQMKKTLAALLGAGAVLLAAACGSSDEGSDSAGDATTATSAAASGDSAATGSTGVELGQSYDEICNAMLPYFDQLEGWGQNRDEAAKAVADAQQMLPGWADLDEDQKADTLRAIENAGKGEC